MGRKAAARASPAAAAARRAARIEEASIGGTGSRWAASMALVAVGLHRARSTRGVGLSLRMPVEFLQTITRARGHGGLVVTVGRSPSSTARQSCTVKPQLFRNVFPACPSPSGEGLGALLGASDADSNGNPAQILACGVLLGRGYPDQFNHEARHARASCRPGAGNLPDPPCSNTLIANGSGACRERGWRHR